MDFARSGSSSEVVPKRREARLPATLQVRILGIDAHGKAFHQAATTLDISLSGARITGLAAQLNLGDIVGLQSGGGKSRFKVSWVSGNRDGTYQAGLHCLEKGGSPWHDTMEQAKEGDRRSDERFSCSGTASLRSASFATTIWGTLRDVSERGCYVQCVHAAETGDILSGQFTINGVLINCVAEVRNSVPSVGMGLLWCDLGCDGQGKLNSILRTLARTSVEPSSGNAKALSQVNKLHQLVAELRERLENGGFVVNVETIGRLSDAQEKLAAALKSMHR
jgi:PilZ domain